jgi:predicted transcriptional regulator
VATNLTSESKKLIEEEIARGLADVESGNVIEGEEAFRRLRDYAARQRKLARITPQPTDR